MYFFLMRFDFKPFVKAVAPLVTLIQILQMVLGLLINGFAVANYAVGNYCHIQDIAVYFAVAMYGSYFVLFSQLFREHNAAKRTRGQAKLAEEVSAQRGCEQTQAMVVEKASLLAGVSEARMRRSS